MVNQSPQQIFKAASVSHYNASLFFPSPLKEAVTKVYAFVRIGDDLVDKRSYSSSSLTQFHQLFHQAYLGKPVNNPVIVDFVDIMDQYNLEIDWIEAYFESMYMDLSINQYKNISELLRYIYGCAEVIGLIMCQLMSLPHKAHLSARLLARSMQYANFIRDINEDNQLGRTYFPQTDLINFGLVKLTSPASKQEKKQFQEFINYQIRRYYTWYLQAIRGYKYIPKNYLPAIKTAADMYYWTVKQISDQPLIVYQQKVKPTRAKVLLTGISNYLYAQTRDWT